MSNIFIFSLITLLMTMFLSLIGLFLPIVTPKLEKSSPYECGFDPINSPRLPFSFRFFLVGMLFLIFDLEIALLLPFPITFLHLPPKQNLLFLSCFLMLLMSGLLFEWMSGGLEWAKD